MKNLRLFFQSYCLLIQPLAEAVAVEWWKRKTKDYHQKLNVRLASQTAKQLGLTILRNEKLLRLPN